MARTASQKRYYKKRLKTLTGPQLRVEEWEFLRAEKAKTGKSWLELLYRGLGLKRSECLKLIRFDTRVPLGPNESHAQSHS